jgi:hypothetical protein
MSVRFNFGQTVLTKRSPAGGDLAHVLRSIRKRFIAPESYKVRHYGRVGCHPSNGSLAAAIPTTTHFSNSP